MPWISIGASPPTHGQKVLIAATDGTVTSAIACYWHGTLTWNPCGWDGGHDWEWEWDGPITHWQPLPDPPQP